MPNSSAYFDACTISHPPLPHFSTPMTPMACSHRYVATAIPTRARTAIA